MKITVFGKSGQLSQALQRHIKGSHHDVIYFDRHDCNLAADSDEIRSFTSNMKMADIVILAAAYTGVEQAENDEETAFAVNAVAPSVISDVCKKRGIPLIYISTDYVFDGQKSTPYLPQDLTNPLNVYGRSKRAGELAILGSGADATVLRTSWLFGGFGRNFMTTMLKLEESGKRIRVIGDQIGRPTYVEHLAEAVMSVAGRLHRKDPNGMGLYHVTNTGEPVSWAEFAREIFEKSETTLSAPVFVDEILTREYEKKVARPAYSVLDTSSFEKTFDVALPEWRAGLILALAEWQKHAG